MAKNKRWIISRKIVKKTQLQQSRRPFKIISKHIDMFPFIPRIQRFLYVLQFLIHILDAIQIKVQLAKSK